MLNAVIDFGGTNIKIALMKDSKMLKSLSLPAHSAEGIVPRLNEVKECIFKMLRIEGMKAEDLFAVGIATPGIVNFMENRILSTNAKYPDAIDVGFNRWCEESFSCPLVMGNDANMALLGEVSFGCARGYENAVLLTIGTGLGTAAFINGRLLYGKHYQAGCLGGHFIIDINGRQCSCGSRGCAETLGGSRELERWAPLGEGFTESKLCYEKKITMEKVIQLMKTGDTFCTNLFNYMIDIYTATIVNLIHAYDPEIVVLSGGVMKSKEYILPELTRKVYSMAWTPWGKVGFAVADDPDSSVLFGLEALIQSNFGILTGNKN